MKVKGAVLLLLWTSTAVAQTDVNHISTGNELANTCNHFLAPDDNTSTFLDGVCFGYITGVDTGVPDCEGKSVTYGQQVKVVLKYMDEHPEQLDQPSANIIRRALLAAFPCTK